MQCSEDPGGHEKVFNALRHHVTLSWEANEYRDSEGKAVQSGVRASGCATVAG